jgi:hypothetical protein
MPGLVPGIHVFLCCRAKAVDGRDKPGHDEVERSVPASIGIRSFERLASVFGRPAWLVSRMPAASLTLRCARDTSCLLLATEYRIVRPSWRCHLTLRCSPAQHTCEIAPRRDAPEILSEPFALLKQGRGECRVPNAPAAWCAHVGSEYAQQYSQRRHRKHPAFPTQWFYDLLRALPGDRAFLPRHLADPSPQSLASAS